MSLAEAFDTHIKAMSTAEEWEKYKAMVEQPSVYNFVIDKIRAVGEPKYIREPFRCNTGNVEIRSVEGITSWGNFNQNNKAMKYRVITDQFMNLVEGDVVSGDLHVDGQAVEKLAKFTDWFEPVEQVQVGDWVYAERGDAIAIAKMGEDSYGFYNGEWVKHADFSREYFDNFRYSNFRKATTHEIESALIKEAKRRGLVAGKTVKSACHQLEEQLREDKAGYKYIEQHDMLYLDNTCLYQEGEFAEIVDQTPHIEINGYEAEFHEDYVQFDCAKIHKEHILKIHDRIKGFYNPDDFDFENEDGYKVVTGIKFGKGIFSREDIKKIAEYYE